MFAHLLMPVRRRSHVLFAALACLAVLVSAAPATAHPIPHAAAPTVTNLRPAYGSVVPGGQVTVAALVVGNAPLRSRRLLIDGLEVPTSAGSGDHPTIAATLPLPAGDHIADLEVTTEAGTTRRAWRFTVADVGLRRLAGDGRLQTAVAISRDLYPQKASSAVLARADDFPDALAGVPVAVAVDGPLLLTERERLSPVTAAELERVLLSGATVHLLGGETALSPQVAADVRARGFAVERLAGDSRYATAAAIAERVPPAADAFVVSGVSFADALAASSPAGRQRWPILLSRPDRLPEETRAALVAREVQRVVVVGGEKAVAPAVLDQLRAVVPEVVRLAGPGRYDTARAVGDAFWSDADAVAVANGERFPDALAGGRHAAGRDLPLLLAPADRLLAPQVLQLGEWAPRAGVLYGGPAALADIVATDLRRASVDGGGPWLRRVEPAAGREVHTLDQIVVEFDRALQVRDSSIYVTLGGTEVLGGWRQGEFESSLVFTVNQLPSGVTPGVVYDVVVTVAAFDGQRWRHVEHRFVYRKLDLSRGDSGPLVRDLQQRLMAAGYWLGAVDGVYGTLTHQAVMALQKTHGLAPDGVYGRATRRLLESNAPRPRPRSTSGRLIEVDLSRQILMIVTNGQVDWIFNTSTGHGRVYEFNGAMYRATTTTGRRPITRQIDGMREAERGLLWRPKYFDSQRGIAIHGATSVPSYPASSGCVRLTYAAIDFIWNTGQAPLGTDVWVYPENYYS